MTEQGGAVRAILFSDVVGSTELYASEGDVAARRRIAEHHDRLVERIVTERGGRVVKTLGDGALAVFESPRAALEAAADLQRSSTDLPMRIGINVGEVLEEDGDVHGAAVATAARVAALARGGQVLLTDVVRRLAGTVPGLRLAPAGEATIKGFIEAVPIAELLLGKEGSATPLPAPRTEATPIRSRLLGRREEISRLRGWLDDARAGHGGMALIEGEPGIGKTRLAEELAGYATASGLSVAWGRCVEAEGVPPHWPWRRVMAALGGDESLLAGDIGGDPEDRFAAHERVAGWLQELAADRGALVVLDDIHWADHASVLLLAHVARSLRDARLAVVGTMRSTERGPIAAELGRLTRLPGTWRLALVGLGEADVRVQLESVSGQEVDEIVARHVRDATGGNPFFVEEIARAALGGDLATAIPSSVRDVIHDRLAQLDVRTANVLHAASVIGREFEASVVASMIGESVGDTLGALDEATSAGLVDESGRIGVHRFHHALIRDAVDAGLSAARRAHLHGAAARSIEMLHADDLAGREADLAQHWSAAAALDSEAARSAVRWSVRAAETAMRDLGYEDSVRFYELAMSAAGAGAGSLPLERCRLLLGRARAHYSSAEGTACVEDCLAAASIAREHGDAFLLAEAALVFQAMGPMGRSAQLVVVCDEALAAIEHEDDNAALSLKARLLAQRSHLCLYNGEEDLVAELSAEAMRLAERSGDDIALIAALRARQEASSDAGSLDELTRIAATMMAAGQRLRSPWVRMWARLWEFEALFTQARFDEVAPVLDALEVEVRQVGGPYPRWHLLRGRAALAQAQGRFGDARSAAVEARDVITERDPRAARGVYFSAMIVIGHHTGHRTEDVELMVAAAQDEPPPFHHIAVAAKAIALVDLGRVDEAAAAFRSLGPPAAWKVVWFIRAPVMNLGLRVACILGRREDAEALHANLLPYAGRGMAGIGTPCYLGPVEFSLGLAEALLGRVEDAVAHLEWTVEQCDRSGAAGFAVEAREALARVLVERNAPGDRDRARTLVSGAMPAAEALGMAPFTNRCRELAILLEDRSPASGSPLSRREEEVAALVAEGRTNREIAETLFLSERTAQNHVQHILTKLGFTNRSQIAAWVAGRRNE